MRTPQAAACVAGLLLSGCVSEERSLAGSGQVSSASSPAEVSHSSAPSTQRAGTPRFVFHADASAPEFGAVDVVSLGTDALRDLERDGDVESWQSVLAIYTGAEAPTQPDAQPVLGRYAVVDGRLRFTPRFPPIAGQSYYARLDLAALRRVVSSGGDAAADQSADPAVVDTTLVVPRAVATPSTYVEAIYPSGDRVPMNLLRLYIHFSAPMSAGVAAARVRLLDAEGHEVEDAFLRVPEELWDPERRRLTVLFDPGRIKRDLRPHEELGLPLREGRAYTLVVDSAWTDAEGNRLRADYRKRFSVGPEDRSLPRTEDWRITPPSAGTREAIGVDFPESLDHALLARVLVVKTEAGGPLAGHVDVGVQETQWTFTPAAPWRRGAYVLEVGTELEDLAGNNLRELFDVDRKVEQPRGAVGDRVRIAFAVS